jgi:glycosyltransferase involved in cell wall biosynthesis
MKGAHGGLPRRLLVVDAEIPRPDQDAGSERMLHLLGLLRAASVAVDFAALDPRAPERYLSRLEAVGVRRLAEPAPAAFEGAGDCDAVIISRAPTAARCLQAARLRWPGARVVFDTVDLYHVRLYRAARLSGSLTRLAQALKMKGKEVKAVRRADATLVVSEAERALLLAAAPGSRVHVVPTVYEAQPPTPPAAGRAGLLFVGSWRHTPNVDAAEYLARQVLPLVRARLGAVDTYLVGPNPPEAIQDLPENMVSVTGYLSEAELEALHRRCRASVAPLRYGAGVKGKVLSSLSRGLPVVTTAIGAEGLGAVNGEHLLVAEGEAALAQAIARLCQDDALWTRLAANGRRLVAEHFSAATAWQGLHAALCG